MLLRSGSCLGYGLSNDDRLIGAIAAFSALILVLSFFRPVPEKRADWAAGVLQLVLGGAVGFAL